jgi:hypothetical protein
MALAPLMRTAKARRAAAMIASMRPFVHGPARCLPRQASIEKVSVGIQHCLRGGGEISHGVYRV